MLQFAFKFKIFYPQEINASKQTFLSIDSNNCGLEQFATFL